MNPATADADLRYPIGRYRAPQVITDEHRRQWIYEIAEVPSAFRRAVEGLTEAQLGTPYRPGGWTVRQVVHHVPDSHLNAYVRFKLALTENEPIIKPYDQGLWAELPDTRMVPVEASLRLLEALHERWTALLRHMSPQEFKRAYFHPEQSGLVPLEHALGSYAWHGRHHVAHVMALRERESW